MKNFIIDEMIIRECDTLKNPDGKDTIRSLDFVTSFIQSEHKLGINKKIERKFRDYQNEIKNKGSFSNPWFSTIINHLLRSDKIIERDGTPGNYNPIRVKKCDREFVGVSIHLRGVLVTNDEPLIKNIKKHQLDLQFKIVKIDDAKQEL